MKKVMVIGCPGSGKSTFSRKLQEATGIPVFYLDMLYWNADKTTVSKSIFRNRQQEILTKDEWILDGNYASTIELRLQFSDTVFFLDYPVEVCLSGIEERKGKKRLDMPWIEPVGEEDEEFIQFVREYNSVTKPVIMEQLRHYPNVNVRVFQDRKDADKYLSKYLSKGKV